jgi:hypothetical protein
MSFHIWQLSIRRIDSADGGPEEASEYHVGPSKSGTFYLECGNTIVQEHLTILVDVQPLAARTWAWETRFLSRDPCFDRCCLPRGRDPGCWLAAPMPRHHTGDSWGSAGRSGNRITLQVKATAMESASGVLISALSIADSV